LYYRSAELLRSHRDIYKLSYLASHKKLPPQLFSSPPPKISKLAVLVSLAGVMPAVTVLDRAWAFVSAFGPIVT